MTTIKLKLNRVGLQLRIMVYVTIGLFALLAGLGYFAIEAVHDTRDQVLREPMALAYSLAQDINQDFEFLASDLRLASESVNLSSQDSEIIVNKISELIKQHAASHFFSVSYVGILNRQGQLLASTPPTTGEIIPPDTTLVKIAIETNEPLIINSRRAAEAGEPFASVVMPVRAAWTGNLPMAVVADTVGVSGIPPDIPGGGTNYSMEVIAVDGRIIISTSYPETVGSVSSHYNNVKKNIEFSSSGVGIYQMQDESGDHEVVAIMPLPSGSFYLLLKEPSELALVVPSRRWNELMAVSGAGMVLILAAAWYTTRKVVRPVEQLRATARAFAQGSLDTPVRVTAQDELVELAEDVESMRQQLKKSRDDLAKTNLELEKKVAQRTQTLQETLGKIITAQEEERRRLARELHDEQSQSLGALSVSLDRINRLLVPSQSEIKLEIDQARNIARSLLRDTRRLIYDLRPSVLDDMGLEAAIRWCAETHLEQHGIQVTLKNTLGQVRMPDIVEVALFRVAQEAIVNIERHSCAKHAGVALEQFNSLLRIQVWDDGKGFALSRAGGEIDTKGAGIEGMQERVRLIGGDLKITSTPGNGTKIDVEVPLD